MRTFTTINEIIQANEAISHHFFSTEAMRFFKSKVQPEIFHGNVFITSEKHRDTDPRLFTVRCALSNGSIETISKFQAFKTKRAAIKWAKALPARITEAIECVKNEFNTGKKTGMGFLSHALVEPTNNRDSKFSMDTFCGACTWLLINWGETDLTYLKDMAGEFEKTLMDKWQPVPTNKDVL